MVPELRPRSVGEVLDAAVALFRAKFRALVAVTFLVVAPMTVLNFFVTLSALPDDYETSFDAGFGPSFSGEDTDAAWLGAFVVTFLVTALATAFVTAAATRIVADAYVQHTEPTGEAVRNVVKRLPAVIGLTVMTTLGVIAGFFACVLPGVILQSIWAIAVPVLVLEGAAVFKAMGRSFQLAQARFWLVLGVHWLAQMLVSVVTYALSLGIAFVVVANDSTTGDLVAQSVASGIASVLLLPFLATAVVALYFDLRIRAEAFDVQMMISALDARRAAPGPSTVPST